MNAFHHAHDGAHSLATNPCSHVTGKRHPILDPLWGMPFRFALIARGVGYLDHPAANLKKFVIIIEK